MTAAAAIDIGSNAIRLAIGIRDRHGKLSLLEDFRESIRLGQDVFSQNYISEDAIRRAESAFRRFKSLISAHQVTLVSAVGTSALREARNREEFVERIEGVSGIRVKVIGGEEEARLVQVAVADQVNFKGKLALLIDIGGGSIEISLVDRGNIVISDSLKMGTVRLIQMLEARKRGQKLFARLVRGYSDGLRRQLSKELKGRKVDFVVGTGGNIDALAQLSRSVLKRGDGKTLGIRELKALLRRLQSLSYEDRIVRLGLKPDRADVIVPAGIILLELLEHAGTKNMLAPGVGLKEGLLHELLPHGKSVGRSAHRNQVLAFARELGRKYEYDVGHAESVRGFCSMLFDRLRPLHKLNEEYRLILELGGLLHDIGTFININSHHRHSYYLLRTAPFVGLSQKERILVALIARYHRKSGPKSDHPELTGLDKNEREVVTKLAAIVRLADALDCEHSARVTNVRISLGKRRVELRLKGRGNLELERWSLTHKADLFEEIFDRTLEVKA